MNRPIEPGMYQLQSWNGVDWEVGHPYHRCMTAEQWVAIRPDVRKWGHPWRLIRFVLSETSRKKPPEQAEDAHGEDE